MQHYVTLPRKHAPQVLLSPFTRLYKKKIQERKKSVGKNQ